MEKYPQFDIFMKTEENESRRNLLSDFHSDLNSLVESESDEEQEYISVLTRQMALSTLENHKGLSRSPQSTLVVDLLYEAVGEVARMKIMEEEAKRLRQQKTDFFAQPKNFRPNYGGFYPNHPPLPYHQLQMAQFQRLNQGVFGSRKEDFMKYPMSQNQQQSGHCRPKRECAGTGVFIPRTQTQTRKKPGCPTVLLPDKVVHVHPTYNGGILKYRNKGDQLNNNRPSMYQQRRNLVTQPATMSQELMLPQEWTY